MAVRDFIRERFFPHIWCPGCGHGTTLNALLHAFDELGLDPCSLVMVSGIGCSARISGYVNVHSMHTLHGRALAFATGIKLARPDLNVVVPMGDGEDGTCIVETPEEIVDASVSTQMSTIRDILHEQLGTQF